MFKWVHISDLHFYNSKRDDVKKMKDTLSNQFESHKDIDALFITGDFRFAKESNDVDVDEIIAYITKLADSLKIKLNQVYCVPGNHDLNRGNIREALIQSIRKEDNYNPLKGYFEDDILEALKKDFTFL